MCPYQRCWVCKHGELDKLLTAPTAHHVPSSANSSLHSLLLLFGHGLVSLLSALFCASSSSCSKRSLVACCLIAGRLKQSLQSAPRVSMQQLQWQRQYQHLKLQCLHQQHQQYMYRDQQQQQQSLQQTSLRLLIQQSLLMMILPGSNS